MYCCEDISLIENYDKAIADKTQTWVCHHRREIIENKRAKQLKDENVYWRVSASELIFMTLSEHMRIHNTGKYSWCFGKPSWNKGLPPWNKGKPCSKKTKRKISKALKGKASPMKGKHQTDEAKKKVSMATKGENNPMYGKQSPTAGTCWFNNGIINVRTKKCPKGFIKGRLKL